MLDSARRLAIFLLASTLALWAAPVRAWGPQGHRIATRVAEARLTPKAARAVRELLNEGDTLVDVANWADNQGHDVVPGSAPWHYVNVPLAEKRFDPRFCPQKGCVVSKIRHYRAVLADLRAPRRERQRALLFLVHFVEDVHQPLHVGDNDDQGGNLTQVQFLDRGTNLHRLWDSDLIHHAHLPEHAWVERITSRITPEKVEEWSRSEVEDWATESLEAARRAYFYPEGSTSPLRAGTRLGDDYATLARPILEDRLARAGVRVANELNAIFR